MSKNMPANKPSNKTRSKRTHRNTLVLLFRHAAKSCCWIRSSIITWTIHLQKQGYHLRTVLYCICTLHKPSLTKQIILFGICPEIKHILARQLERQLPYKQFLLTFPWQLTLPPPRPLLGTSSTMYLRPVLSRPLSMSSTGNPYSLNI